MEQYIGLIVDIVSWACLLTGSFLGLSGAIGMMRFPDFFSRVHAASVTDTLCSLLIIFGLMLQAGLSLVAVKLYIILLLLWFTSPVSSHSLVKAAYQTGLRPLLKMQKAEHDDKTRHDQPANATATVAEEGASSKS